MIRLLLALTMTTPAGAAPLRIAVLPPADDPQALAAVRAVAGQFDLEADVLTPEQLVDPETFSANRYDLALQIGHERYLYTISREGDAAAALLRYLGDGGTLLVGGFVWPFYRAVDWTGGEYRRTATPPDPGIVPDPAFQEQLKRMGQSLTGTFNFVLGLYVGRGGTEQFEAPSEPVEFELVEARGLGVEWPERILWNDAADQRFRPVATADLPAGIEADELVRLRGKSGKDYGPGAALVRFTAGPCRGGTVVYAWAQLWAGRLGRELVLATLLDIGRRKATAEQAALLRRTTARCKALGERLEAIGADLAKATDEGAAAGYLARERRAALARLGLVPTMFLLGHEKAATTMIETLSTAAERLSARASWLAKNTD